jgi:hypothetical protein
MNSDRDQYYLQESFANYLHCFQNQNWERSRFFKTDLLEGDFCLLSKSDIDDLIEIISNFNAPRLKLTLGEFRDFSFYFEYGGKTFLFGGKNNEKGRVGGLDAILNTDVFQRIIPLISPIILANRSAALELLQDQFKIICAKSLFLRFEEELVKNNGEIYLGEIDSILFKKSKIKSVRLESFWGSFTTPSVYHCNFGDIRNFLNDRSFFHKNSVLKIRFKLNGDLFFTPKVSLSIQGNSHWYLGGLCYWVNETPYYELYLPNDETLNLPDLFSSIAKDLEIIINDDSLILADNMSVSLVGHKYFIDSKQFDLVDNMYFSRNEISH